MFDGRNLDYPWEEVFATVIEEFDSKGAVSEMPTLRPSGTELVNTAAYCQVKGNPPVVEAKTVCSGTKNQLRDCYEALTRGSNC